MLPPDIERSGLDFEPEGNAIRFGLLAIKNVGAGAAESIVAELQMDMIGRDEEENREGDQ